MLLERARSLDHDVKFTRHAIDRMTYRGILKPTVLAVIANGISIPHRKNELIQWGEWCVIMSDNWVITVFYKRRYNE